MFKNRVRYCDLAARRYDRETVLYMVLNKLLNTCKLLIFSSNLQQSNNTRCKVRVRMEYILVWKGGGWRVEHLANWLEFAKFTDSSSRLYIVFVASLHNDLTNDLGEEISEHIFALD